MIGAAVLGAGLILATADSAEAARRRAKPAAHAGPPTASMLVDAKTGRIIQANNADAPRIPASLTKVMTLYLLFEQLDRGRLTLDTPMRVSARAAAQPPTKLGLQPGETITVEDAIRGMVTKSANDASVVVAETIAGSEEAFAEQMTRRARALGMARTSFYNAHGLPNSPPNITTARDLVTLGRAIQDRFPKYYQYFATRSFDFNGTRVVGHNRLLGRVEGVDGIKTGYTRASGFNILTSARTDGRHVVGVVLGGRSGRARDVQMASLIETGLERAYAGARTAPQIGETVVASAEPEAPATTASIAPPQPVSRPLDLSNVRPVAASAAALPAPAPVKTASLAPIPLPKPAAEDAPRVVTAYAPVRQTASAPPRPPAAIRQAAASSTPAAPAAATAISKQTIAAAGGWVIQLGATDNQDKAKEVLAKAKSKARTALSKASPFTERISKDGATLWRARFAGFDAEEAQAACKTLKRDGFNCFASRG
ncbi:MAG: D-alanyl-D-alanine carboxypeptidase [Rhizobiales bacterium]|nr:D-alanyl-D-alanine carboxypeptidase [Hyphomicrobiales bacterium]